MKEAFEGVREDAAIIRSPSFSREGESRTITNSSFAVGDTRGLAGQCESGGGRRGVTECA